MATTFCCIYDASHVLSPCGLGPLNFGRCLHLRLLLEVVPRSRCPSFEEDVELSLRESLLDEL